MQPSLSAVTTYPSDIVLDVTRTLSRVGAGGDSGVDRVERAYISALMDRPERAFFLSRVAGGAALLDRDGMRRFLGIASDPDRLPKPDAVGLISRRLSPARRRAETAMRTCALGWARRSKLRDLLRSHAAPGFALVNVGHTHLDEATLASTRAAGAGTIAVMIHDVIPLDFPEFARAGTVERFRTMLGAVARHADLLIFNSEHTAQRTRAAMAGLGRPPASVTALLGVDPVAPAPRDRTPATPAEFIALGTIEPRKNHMLLLSIWRQFAAELPEAEVPHLHIVGRRGWEIGQVEAILDRAPFMGRVVFEHGHLGDAELGRRMARARALLFPSFAEGFGFPLAEALQAGVPVIASDLPVFREIAATAPTYLDPLDGPGWKNAIIAAASSVPAERSARVDLPTWTAHFALVFDSLARCANA